MSLELTSGTVKWGSPDADAFLVDVAGVIVAAAVVALTVANNRIAHSKYLATLASNCYYAHEHTDNAYIHQILGRNFHNFLNGKQLIILQYIVQQSTVDHTLIKTIQ